MFDPNIRVSRQHIFYCTTFFIDGRYKHIGFFTVACFILYSSSKSMRSPRRRVTLDVASLSFIFILSRILIAFSKGSYDSNYRFLASIKKLTQYSYAVPSTGFWMSSHNILCFIFLLRTSKLASNTAVHSAFSLPSSRSLVVLHNSQYFK